MKENLLPLMLKFDGKRALVVGGGKVALDKVERLLECNSDVLVVSPELCDGLKDYVEQGKISYVCGTYEPQFMEGVDVVFACTDDNVVNKQVFSDAQARRIWVNVVDVPDLCTFYMPSILRRNELVIAVATTGASPALARKIRLWLEELIGEELGILASLLRELRPEVKEKIATVQERREFMDRVWDSDALTLIRQGKLDEARERIRECMSPS